MRSTVAPGPAPLCSPLGYWLVRAITIVDGHLEVGERPLPEPGPDGVVVRIHGAGLNRADLLQRAGRYPAPPGVPADRLAILRKAFDETLKDPEFLENAKRQRLPVDEPMTGEQLAERASQIGQTPSAAVRGLADMFKHFKDSP